METVKETGPRLGIAPSCAALGLPRATFYRQLAPMHGPHERRTPKRALSPEQRKAVLDVLHEPRFVDLAPAEVWSTLLDEGRFLCSERTMYRVLEENQEVRERRNWGATAGRPLQQGLDHSESQPNVLNPVHELGQCGAARQLDRLPRRTREHLVPREFGMFGLTPWALEGHSGRLFAPVRKPWPN
jgi:hypothetical protein